MKLQVGKDYINESGDVIHIQSFSNVTNHYLSTNNITSYKENGSVTKGTFNLVAEVLTKDKEPTLDKQEPNDALIYFGWRESLVDCTLNDWIAAINWYKSQINKE